MAYLCPDPFHDDGPGRASRRPVDVVPPPARVRALPRNKVGYPIPWFAATMPDGERDLRVVDPAKVLQAIRDELCWVCGQRLGVFRAFVIGPMCAVNRITAEPPTHLECAQYAVRVCPFLVVPGMRRRSKDDIEWSPAAGDMIERNPGVALIWVTRSFRAFNPSMGNAGVLFQLGEPVNTWWLREGRAATRAEVVDALDSGLPALLAACERDDDPEGSRADVRRQLDRAMALVPA